MLVDSFKIAFRQEASWQFRGPALWLCFTVLIIMTLQDVLGVEFNTLTAGSGLPKNAGYLAYISAGYNGFWVSAFGIYFLAAAIIRDQRFALDAMVQTSPISLGGYRLGRAAAGFLAMALITLGGPIGFVLAPFIASDPTQFGPPPLAQILSAWAIITVPLIVAFGGMQLGLCARVGKLTPAYIAPIAVVTTTITFAVASESNPGLVGVASFLDSTGHVGVQNALVGWGQEERVNALLTPSGGLLWGRIVWPLLGIGCMVWGFSYQPTPDTTKTKRGAQSRDRTAYSSTAQRAELRLDQSLLRAGALWRFLSSARLGVDDMVLVTRDPIFRLLVSILSVMALMAAFGMAEFVVQPLGVLRPVTSEIVLSIARIMFGMIVIISIFYSGEIIFRERLSNTHLLIDASPAPDWALFIRKLIAVFSLALICSLTIILPSLLAQFMLGNWSVDWRFLYEYTFIRIVPPVFFYAALGFVGHSISGSRVIGNIIGIGYAFFLGIARETSLFESDIMYVGLPTVPVFYDAFDGFGEFRSKMIDLGGFWLAIAVVFVLVAGVNWRRGLDDMKSVFRQNVVTRWRLSALAAVFMSVAIVQGGVLYHRMYIVNDTHSHEHEQEVDAEYERIFGDVYRDREVLAAKADIRLQLDPDRRTVEALVSVVLQNFGPTPVNDMLLTLADGVELVSIDADAEQHYDAKLHVVRLRFSTPLAPGDQRTLTVNTREVRRHYVNGLEGDRNGTLTQSVAIVSQRNLPVIGYDRSRELVNPTLRDAYGLGARLPARDGAIYGAPGVAPAAPVSIIAEAPPGWTVVAGYGSQWPPIVIAAPFETMKSDDGMVDVFFAPKHRRAAPNVLVEAVEVSRIVDGLLGAQSSAIKVAESPRGLLPLDVSDPLILAPEEDVWLQDQSRLGGQAWMTYRLAAGIAKLRLRQMAPPQDKPGVVLGDLGLALAVALAVVEERHGRAAADGVLDASTRRYLKESGAAGRAEPRLVDAFDEIVPDHDGNVPSHGYVADRAMLALSAVRRADGDELFWRGVKRWLQSDDAGDGAKLVDYVGQAAPALFRAAVNYDVQVIAASTKKVDLGWRTNVELRISETCASCNAPQGVQVEVQVGEKSQFTSASVGMVSIVVDTQKRPDAVIADPNRLLIDRNRGNNRLVPKNVVRGT